MLTDELIAEINAEEMSAEIKIEKNDQKKADEMIRKDVEETQRKIEKERAITFEKKESEGLKKDSLFHASGGSSLDDFFDKDEKKKSSSDYSDTRKEEKKSTGYSWASSKGSGSEKSYDIGDAREVINEHEKVMESVDDSLQTVYEEQVKVTMRLLQKESRHWNLFDMHSAAERQKETEHQEEVTNAKREKLLKRKREIVREIERVKNKGSNVMLVAIAIDAFLNQLTKQKEEKKEYPRERSFYGNYGYR